MKTLVLILVIILGTITSWPFIITLLVCTVSQTDISPILMGVFFYVLGLKIGKATELL